MKKGLVLLTVLALSLGFAGFASANLIANGSFDDGFTNWKTSGDVRIANTAGAGGWFAEAHGMSGSYALLGLKATDGRSQIRQDFDVTGYTSLDISFNWAFNYWDNSSTAEDTFISFVRQDGKPAFKITLLDLTTNGTFFSSDVDLAYGEFSGSFDISNYVTDDARLIFRLVEDSDDDLWSGTGSVAGIDNVEVGGAPVPEPATLLLLGSGLAGLAVYRRKRK